MDQPDYRDTLCRYFEEEIEGDDDDDALGDVIEMLAEELGVPVPVPLADGPAVGAEAAPMVADGPAMDAEAMPAADAVPAVAAAEAPPVP